MDDRMGTGNAVRIRGATIRYTLLSFTPSIFILIVIVAPFIDLALTFGSLNFYRIMTGSSPIAMLSRRALYNSLIQGGVSAVFSLLLGYPLGVFLGRNNFRFKKLIVSLVILPFFLPSLVVVYAFMSGFGQGSPASILFSGFTMLSRGFVGIIAVNTFFNAPLVALYTMSALSTEKSSQIEAVMSLGASDVRGFFTVFGKDTLLAALGGATLAFAYSFAGFAAPLIIGGPGAYTLDAWIYFMFRILGNFHASVSLAIFEAISLIVPTIIYVRILSTQRREGSVESRINTAPSRRSVLFLSAFAYMVAWLIIEAYLLSSVVLRALRANSTFSATNFLVLFSNRTTSATGISALGSILNSLFYGFVVSIVVVAAGMAWIAGRKMLHKRYLGTAEVFHFIPLVISSLLMAFAILIVYGINTPQQFLWILIVSAQIAVAIPVVMRTIDAGFSPISREFLESSLTLGGHPFLDVEIPLAKVSFYISLMFGFAISLGEFTATNFLATPKFFSLPVEIYSLQLSRLFGPSFAAATVLLFLSLLVFVLIQRMGEKFIGVR